MLDILDGALARAGGKTTPFGAFLDSTTDRIGEAFMLGAIALALARDGNETGFLFTFAALAGSFLVPYARSKAEALGLRGDVGLGSRAERVVVITGGLVFAPWGGLQWAIYVLAATAWLTVVQRVWHVRTRAAPPRLDPPPDSFSRVQGSDPRRVSVRVEPAGAGRSLYTC